MAVFLLQAKKFTDSRGWFSEVYNARALAVKGIAEPFVQDNHSFSRFKGTIRGLHFQSPPHGQGKLVRCLYGSIFDVAVDIRKDSPTFGRWVGEILSAENKKQLWIPEGLAHGFLVLSDTAEFLYKTTDYYAPSNEGCLRWDDPTLAIMWPLDGTPALSSKDQNGLLFTEIFDTNGMK